MYSIRKAFLIPFSLVVLLLFFLLLISFSFRGTHSERIFLAVIFIVTLAVFLEAKLRNVRVEEQGMRFRKFLRTREIGWEDITNVGALTVHRKVYILLTTVKGIFILSNAYDRFPALLRDIVAYTNEKNVDGDVRDQIDHPVTSWGNVVAAWIAVAVIAGIIFTRLFPY